MSTMPSVRTGHPRLGFAPETARRDAARLTRSPFWSEFERRARGHLVDVAPEPRALTTALSHGGLLALATGDAHVEILVGKVVDLLAETVAAGKWNVDDDLEQGFLLTDLAFGFDWAWLSLTDVRRTAGAAALVALAEYSRKQFAGYFTEGSYSAFNNHTIWNHVGVAAAGLAAAGEHPGGQEHAALTYEFFTRIFLPVFDAFVGKHGCWNEGTHYNQVAIKPTLIWMEAARTALGEDHFAAPWIPSSAYYWVYLARHDDSMTILGDWWTEHKRETTRTNLMARSFWITARAAKAARDPHLQAFANRQLPYALKRPPEIWNVLWYDPDLPPQPLESLPPSRLFQGEKRVGGGTQLAVLRSGWGKDARLITLSMGDWLSHHGHYDSNAFTIHYKDDLAIDPGYSGEKDTDWTYYRRTIAHNSVLVPVSEAQSVKDNPELKARRWGYDGGQRVMLLQERPRRLEQFLKLRNPEYPQHSLWETGECLAFETHPAWDYVVGDAAKAYHRSQLTRFVRHLVFLKPDTILLYDVIETPAGRQPRWLLQSVDKPTTRGGLWSVTHGGGALHVQTLLPEKASRRHVAGLPLSDYEVPTPGQPITRTEVVGQLGTLHRFLHVLRIADAGSAPPQPASWQRAGNGLQITITGRGTLTLRSDGHPGVRVS